MLFIELSIRELSSLTSIAALRLRKLGRGHSLSYLAPPEVHQEILAISGKTSGNKIDSFDVLKWSMVQTCQNIKRQTPLWIHNGIAYCNRQLIRERFIPSSGAICDRPSNDPYLAEFFKSMQEPERRKLRDMYGVENTEAAAVSRQLAQIKDHDLHKILAEEWAKLNPSSLVVNALLKEQEREIAVELEIEHVAEKPIAAIPCDHDTYDDTIDFINTGDFSLRRQRLVPDRTIQAAFESLRHTSAGQATLPTGFNSKELFVSLDFTLTVEVPKGAPKDRYLRPVLWVLSSNVCQKLLVILPHEANEQLPTIRTSDKVRLHVFAPRLSQQGRDISGLDFYSIGGKSRTRGQQISKDLIRDFNIFAGSLYLRDMQHYEELCQYLGIVQKMPEQTDSRPLSIGSDGFANPATRQALNWKATCPFPKTPIPFLKTLLTLRMRGQTFDNTHMGWITNGKALDERNFTKPRVQKRKSGSDHGGQNKRQKTGEELFVRQDEDEDLTGPSDVPSLSMFVD
jgi:hypothetical protein